MSIKTRLLLSYIAMIIVPVVLFGLAASTWATVFFGDMARGGKESGKPPFWHVFNQRTELVAGVKFMARHEPDRLLDPSMLASVDGELGAAKAEMVLVKNGEVAFASPSVTKAELETLVHGPQPPAEMAYRPANGSFMVDSFDFAFGDQSRGTLYFLSDPRELFASGRAFVLTLVLSLLVIIGLTNGVLTYLVSRSIIRPLHQLKQVAEEIKEGNLERSVSLNRKDELGKLGEAFEEMRGRLYDSVRLQLQYEENRKELIASISHDLKTPITGIQACVQAMQAGIADTQSKREKYLKMVANKAEQMNRLIDELFLHSRLDQKKFPFHWERLDMTSFIVAFTEELQFDPRWEDVHISCILDESQPLPVLADREKLGRVMQNILDNSLKYLEKEEKRIRIALSQGPEQVTVSIEDNGAGIDPAALPHIFDRFYRGDPSRNTDTGGSGLGLAIVKQIVDAHGGSVWADSRLGEGTCIAFTLPRHQTQGRERTSDAF